MNLEAITSRIQGILHIKEDGRYGPATAMAILKYLNPSATEPEDDKPTSDTPQADERSERNILTLEPRVRPYARALVHTAASHGITIKVISGNRTYAEQDALYEQGRSKPGSIVTNARAGFSWHNFGLAFDIGVFADGAYKPESPAYGAVGVLGRSLGLEWGGDWKGNLIDEPHFALNPEKLTIAELRARKTSGVVV